MSRGGGDGDFGKAALAHLDRLYAFACALARDRQAAEDLVQETYLRALRAARHPGPEENLQGWLFTILHNVWRNEARKRRPESLDSHPEWISGLAAADQPPPDAMELERTAERVAAFIDAMPRHLREVIVLRFGEGFSYQQIADVVGCPAGTVMSRLSRGRAMVRRALGPWNGAGRGNGGGAGSDER